MKEKKETRITNGIKRKTPCWVRERTYPSCFVQCKPLFMYQHQQVRSIDHHPTSLSQRLPFSRLQVVFLFTLYKIISSCPQGFCCGVEKTIFQQNRCHMENPKFTFVQVQNKIFKTDEKLAIVVGTQALVLNSPELEFNLSYIEVAKTWSSLNSSEPLFLQV